MARTHTETKDFSVVLPNGKRVTAEVKAVFYYEPNYGSDADGNRGIGMWFFDDMDFPTPILDDEENELSSEEKKEAEELINNAAENDDWTFDA